MTDDIDRIIAGLSEAQRDAVKRGGIGDHRISTANALCRKGLMHLVIDSPNGRCGFFELTDLGLSVRNRLLEMQHGN